jgi:hypothetical protein
MAQSGLELLTNAFVDYGLGSHSGYRCRLRYRNCKIGWHLDVKPRHLCVDHATFPRD